MLTKGNDEQLQCLADIKCRVTDTYQACTQIQIVKVLIYDD
jgi:hypothetical protein